MNQTNLLNPNGVLVPKIAAALRQARKDQPIWARLLENAEMISTLEGEMSAEPGDYLCRGIEDEVWPQKADKLLEKYTPSDRVDDSGWRRFDPKPDAPPVNAAPVPYAFRLQTDWGEMQGKAGDYLVQSTTDPQDLWIVKRSIFEASYQVSSP